MKHRAKRKSAKWIQKTGIAKHKGALHHALGIPTTRTIPVATLRRAAKETGHLGHQARLALTLRGLSHK